MLTAARRHSGGDPVAWVVDLSDCFQSWTDFRLARFDPLKYLCDARPVRRAVRTVADPGEYDDDYAVGVASSDRAKVSGRCLGVRCHSLVAACHSCAALVRCDLSLVRLHGLASWPSRPWQYPVSDRSRL